MRTLLAPETRAGHGSGHLRRAIGLLSKMPNASLLIEQEDGRLGEFLAGVPRDRIVGRAEGEWDRIVIDRFSVDDEQIRRFAALGFTIGIDAGGSGRSWCDYLIDTLPRLDADPANEYEPAYLELPEPGSRDEVRPGSILVSFGGEDPAMLTESTVSLLVSAGYGESVTVVSPSMRKLGELPSGPTVLDPQPSLIPLLRQAECVVTSYGLTAHEARAVAARVVTISPTGYHDRLARAAGFARAGVGSPRPRRLLALVRRPATADSAAPRTTPKCLAERIIELPEPAHRGCPAHPHSFGRAVRRSPEKSYFRCEACGVVYLERFARDEESYGTAYFMEEYRAQYGRTYLEDFDQILALSRVRLDRALRIGRGPVRHVLDVGCAYGPFLAAAKDRGLEPYGIDVAAEAIAHVRGLGIPAACGSILDLDIGRALERESFDLVTLWYVVEHFDRLDLLMERLVRIVRPGGVLAMSTPFGRGVSARRTPDRFYDSSPRDHHTIWDRSSASRILDEYGFRVSRFVITGHHPERYPLVHRLRRRRLGPVPGRLSGRLAALHSRLFGWGDTFEIYAVREGPCSERF